jgi:hypothetical protein
MSFERYYLQEFRKDLSAVFALRPQGVHDRDQHDDWQYSLQPRSVSRENQAITEWSGERKALFAVSLFYTVLVDQVCHTYFRSHYPRFRELTMYPKWRGDCPGGCHGHHHPVEILSVIGASPGRHGASPSQQVVSLIHQAKPFVRQQLASFCEQQMPELPAAHFWEFCSSELPPLILGLPNEADS